MQYVEENERLRAILGEWSARAAKVTVIEPSTASFSRRILLAIISVSLLLVYSTAGAST
jgi:hypothetical protein